MTIRYLKIEGVDYQEVVSVDIIENVHNHGVCTLNLIPNDKFNSAEMLKLSKTKITVSADKDIIFCGFITNCNFESNLTEKRLLVTALSLSVQTDITQKKFTLQKVNKKISDVLKEIEKDYTPAEFSFDKDENVTALIYCDNLTDWEFLKAFAEMNGQILFTDSKTDKLRISVGYKAFNEFSSKENLELLSQSISMELYKKLEANTYSDARSCYFLDTELLTDNLKIGVGYGVNYDNKIQAVIASRIFLRDNYLYNRIIIRHAEGCRASAETVLKHSDKFYYLSGKVLESKDNSVKVQFDCDKSQKKDEARDIPFESPLSNYLYTMPDENEQVLIYTDNIRQAALGTVRTKEISDSADKKSFKIKSAELEFNKEKISFTAEKAVEMTTNDAVKMTAKKDVILSAKGDIIIQSSAGMLPDNQLVMSAPHLAGYTAYLATMGQPATVQFNPAGSTVGKVPSQIQNEGAKKESVELSDIVKELDKLTNRKDNKSEQKNSSGGSGGKINIEGKKSALVQVKDSSIEMKDKNLNVKTRALIQVGYIPMAGGGTGSLSKFEGGTPKNRSDKINVEHGSQDRSRIKEKI